MSTDRSGGLVCINFAIGKAVMVFLLLRPTMAVIAVVEMAAAAEIDWRWLRENDACLVIARSVATRQPTLLLP
jgi:hypothetical protein